MMDNINLKKLYAPITTGNSLNVNFTKQIDTKSSVSFNDVLKDKLTFTKHAQLRVSERNINLSSYEMDKLNEAMNIAKQKGIDETLVLMDKNAFIISAKNNKVITAIGENNLKNNLITNIQGTVVI